MHNSLKLEKEIAMISLPKSEAGQQVEGNQIVKIAIRSSSSNWSNIDISFLPRFSILYFVRKGFEILIRRRWPGCENSNQKLFKLIKDMKYILVAKSFLHFWRRILFKTNKPSWMQQKFQKELETFCPSNAMESETAFMNFSSSNILE